eukprot:TRINITY_DN3634_c0_g1_i1.p1 TRINITY_DN3634_c0_g1~~TRINITY_DN3634_c0_g1_i1.p1  ORF type:complete len:114 (-),score=27.45 TRINITY_DN3634_c0_g1_i1:327-668(-)
MNMLKYVRPGQGYPGPNFPLTRMVKINGNSALPLFKWLKAITPPESSLNDRSWLSDTSSRGLLTTPCVGSDVSWNFHKFLIGKDGKTVRRFGTHPPVLPLSRELTDCIEEMLA